MPTCPNCGNQAADNAIFCDQCGTRLPVAETQPQQETTVEVPAGDVPEGVLICPDCGAENVPGEAFCDVCGNPLEPPEPVAGPTAEAETVVEEVEPEIVEAEILIKEVEPEIVEPEVVEPEPVIEEVEPEVVEAEPVALEATYCPTCGSKVAAGDAFCANCGAALAVAPGMESVEKVEPILEKEIAEEVVIEEVPAKEIVTEIEPEEIAPGTVVVEEPAEEELRCLVCGAVVLADQAFCASCGVALEAAPAAIVIEEPAPTVAGPYLEVVDSGAHIPLVDADELLIGREDQVSGIHPDVDMTPHRGEEGGVSRRHAQLIREGGAWFVMDLDSTNGTYQNGIELQPKVRSPLSDGDTLSLGDVEVVFHAG